MAEVVEAVGPGCVRLENNAESGVLLEAIIGMLGQARARAWVKVAWWDVKSKAGTNLGRALVDASHRGVDVRVIMRNDASGLRTIARLRESGIEVRPSRYLHEKELIVDDAYLSHSMNFTAAETARNSQVGHLWTDPAQVATASSRFEGVWGELAAIDGQRGESARTPAREVVPREWLPLLAHADLNPFQADVAPAVLAATGHAIVVAPTGAGKTLIGELALLRAVKQDRRKGVWLVPARALAGELGRIRERWGRCGISVEVLTGELNLSSERLRRADIWVATTEKFESLCRRTSLQDAVADVACIVVDEIHLIGDPSRGATLEALLARLRFLSDTTRVVGLSATVTNAKDLADWLNADLLRSTWRPTVLVTQLVEYHPAGKSWTDFERAKNAKLFEVVDDIRKHDTHEGGSPSILVFVGSTKAARAVASLLAGVTGAISDQALASQCHGRGVGFHFRGAPGASEALKKFNAREIGVLVATSGLSTGINTPARAVIVRDLALGTSPIEVSQLQQMFGRAGRAGLEQDGYAYLLVPEGETADWARRLAGGYRVDSRMAGKEADAALAEIHLGNIQTTGELESWYATTFAWSQARNALSGQQVAQALASAGLVLHSEGDRLVITDLGRLTVQLMIDVASATGIRKRLDVASPRNAAEAERLVAQAVCAGATTLANRQVNAKDWESAVAASLASRQVPADWEDFGPRFSLATVLEALDSPREVREPAQRDLLQEAPRFFAWVSELGRLGLATWQSVVASDLGERLNARALSTPRPSRGSGRVLRFLRSLVDPEQADQFLKERWRPSSSVVLPSEFPAQSTDHRVVPASLLRAHQGVLSCTAPTVEVRDGMLHVRLGVEGSIERSEVSANCGLDSVHAIGAQAQEVTMPIPAGAARCRQVAVEVVAFSKTDAVYGATVADVQVTRQEPSAQQRRMVIARESLEQARDSAVVQGSNAPRSMFRKRREQAERERLLAIGNNSGLRSVSLALTNGLDELSALWSIREAVEELCPGRTQSGTPRSPAAVLRSGAGSAQELALARYALAKEAGMTARLVQGADLADLHCVVRAGSANYVMDRELPAGRLTWIGTGSAVSITTMPAKPKEPPLHAKLAMEWLAEFMENQPAEPEHGRPPQA